MEIYFLPSLKLPLAGEIYLFNYITLRGHIFPLLGVYPTLTSLLSLVTH